REAEALAQGRIQPDDGGLVAHQAVGVEVHQPLGVDVRVVRAALVQEMHHGPAPVRVVAHDEGHVAVLESVARQVLSDARDQCDPVAAPVEHMLRRERRVRGAGHLGRTDRGVPARGAGVRRVPEQQHHGGEQTRSHRSILRWCTSARPASLGTNATIWPAMRITYPEPVATTSTAWPAAIESRPTTSAPTSTDAVAAAPDASITTMLACAPCSTPCTIQRVPAGTTASVASAMDT